MALCSEETTPKRGMEAWTATYTEGMAAIAAAGDDTAAATAAAEKLMDTFWSTYYNPETTSIWTMTYDEVAETATLEEAKEVVTAFMTNPGMSDATKNMQEHCFGVMHTCANFEIEGLWFFNGPDPEALFSANEDTSWYTWAQLGPEATAGVKAAVAKYITPSEKKIDNKEIMDTRFVFVLD